VEQRPAWVASRKGSRIAVAQNKGDGDGGAHKAGEPKTNARPLVRHVGGGRRRGEGDDAQHHAALSGRHAGATAAQQRLSNVAQSKGNLRAAALVATGFFVNFFWKILFSGELSKAFPSCGQYIAASNF
jgi:hypothetical protein